MNFGGMRRVTDGISPGMPRGLGWGEGVRGQGEEDKA